MARKASVRYWSSRGAYCCEIGGKQVTLCVGPDDAPSGPCYNAAVKRFVELTAGKTATGPTLDEVAGQYLEWAAHHREPDTVRIRRQRLKLVCAELGAEPVARLTSYMIESFCDKQRTARGWGNGTVTATLSSVRACLSWAARKGLVADNPVKHLDIPDPESRGLDCVLNAEQQAVLFAACKRSLREFVRVLFGCGCRPGELSRAESRHFDPGINALVFAPGNSRDKYKTKKKTKKARVIYLAGEPLEIVRRLVARHPSGPIFRTSRAKAKGPHKGERWGFSPHDVALAFYRLRKKTGIKGLVAYSGRHSYAVAWLRSGKPALALCEILGTSVAMLRHHYGHLADDHTYLRKLVEDMDAGR